MSDASVPVDAARIREVRHLVSSAKAFLRHFNPFDLASDKEDQWHSLNDQADRVDALLRDLDAQGADNGVDPQFQAGFNAGQGQFDAAQTDAQGAAPAGWRLVPEEPTEEMKRAGNEALGPWIAPAMNSDSAYRAMLAAAPPSPALHTPTVEACAKQLEADGLWYGARRLRALTSGAEAGERTDGVHQVPWKNIVIESDRGASAEPPIRPNDDPPEQVRAREEAERRHPRPLCPVPAEAEPCPTCKGKGGYRGEDRHGIETDADCDACDGTWKAEPAADAGEVERRSLDALHPALVAKLASAPTVLDGLHKYKDGLWSKEALLWQIIACIPSAALRPAPTEEQVERAAAVARAVWHGEEFLPWELLDAEVQDEWAAVARAILAVGPAPQAGAGR